MRRVVGLAWMVAALVVGGRVALAADGWVYDPDDAHDIMRTCAACHGEAGTGGGGGVYPRLAGLNADYLAEQLRQFKSHVRENLPMIPYANERELPEPEVRTIARYLSELTVQTRPPKDLPSDGFARLEAMKLVLQVPREPGDAAHGGEIYARECSACHGRKGEGHLQRPPLAHQHIPYLRHQIVNFLSGKRPAHADMDKLRAHSETDWHDLWAYVSALDDGDAPAPVPVPAAAPLDYDIGQ